MLIPRYLIALVSLGLIALGAEGVFGQVFPNKPIRIYGGNTGSGNDFAARLLSQGISGPLGQPVVVENRATLIAIETVAKAPPDGYTLIITGPSVWRAPLLRGVAYDLLKDFSPLSLVSSSPNVLVVHPSVPVKTVKDLIALAKVRPGELNYAINTIGGSAHLGWELFKSQSGVNMVGIPFKGGTSPDTALLGGEVQMGINDAGSLAPLIKSGRLRALAVSSLEPSALAPGLPTVAATLPGFEIIGIDGMFAPAKTPEAIIRRLNQEVVRVIKQPDVKEKLFQKGVEAVGSSPEEFAAKINSDTARWAKVIKDAGIRVD